MASAETLEGSNVLLLPEDFLVDIASMLDLKEGCQMERASRGVHDILSRPSYPWPAKRGLNLYHFERPLSSEAFRWFQKRIKRYRHIFCRFCDAKFEGSNDLGEGDAACVVPPRLASLLAACAPSAELSLFVHGTHDLRQHLTELSLGIEAAEDREAPDLGILGMLSALQKLQLDCAAYYTRYQMDLKNQKLKLVLPNLVSFKLRSLKDGELDLSCPRLAELTIERTKSLRITTGYATLAELVLDECITVDVVVPSPKDQLHNIKLLIVLCDVEKDRHLIGELKHMRNLQRLQHDNLPAIYIPRSLPRSLEHLSLHVIDKPDWQNPYFWCPDLAIKSCWKDRGETSWDSASAKPLAELLPLHGVSPLQISLCHRAVTCMTGRGLEAMGTFCCGEFWDTVLVHDPPDDNHKGRFLNVRLQDQEKMSLEARDAEYPISPRWPWLPNLDLSGCEVMDEVV